jgi:hypothetical protein
MSWTVSLIGEELLLPLLFIATNHRKTAMDGYVVGLTGAGRTVEKHRNNQGRSYGSILRTPVLEH